MASCKDYEFYCSKTKRCVGIQALCDGIDDCGDHSDELASEYYQMIYIS